MAASLPNLRPDGLAERGTALWNALNADDTLSTDRAVLLGEACRLADRLDRLDQLLSGDIEVWVRLLHRTRTDDYVLVIDGAASEARQAASTLRQLLAQLSDVKATALAGGSIADELANRRANREAGA